MMLLTRFAEYTALLPSVDEIRNIMYMHNVSKFQLYIAL